MAGLPRRKTKVTPDLRDFLSLLGICYLFASRHLGQAEEILLLDLPGDWRFLPKPGPLNRASPGPPCS